MHSEFFSSFLGKNRELIPKVSKKCNLRTNKKSNYLYLPEQTRISTFWAKSEVLLKFQQNLKCFAFERDIC